jgi:hypothetical protein
LSLGLSPIFETIIVSRLILFSRSQESDSREGK